jgi:hypothetical protein
LKRVVCEVLKGSWAIWIGGKETVYNMMRPKITLDDLEKDDALHREEGSREPEEERTIRNLRVLLQEEMKAGFVGFAEDKDNLRQTLVNATKFKDLTETFVLSNFCRKEEAADEDYNDEDQLYEMIQVADDKNRNERQLEMNA